MKNTARWRLTTGVLNTFVGTVQHAYNYAQDLNESLNSIRVVTKKSSEDMAEFAKQANSAAKTLNTTTTKYTDASLIYYQQGLNDEEVAKRTEATIKLANVSGQTAQEVSERMTAIWNNFDDGTKSLEYYIDVMAKLGATTASSTDEISNGMQKFAAIAGTVGLSYENAASALATLIATTRESADTVGTSLRTIFARVQGLKQGGETEDGVTLTKYSQALRNVGIEVLNADGSLKDMDTTLADIGKRWQELSRSQQMALAQTVAGVRQYASFIALFDNWDFFQQNLQTAYGSEGELQKQADIYAQSWEAARANVKAAAEDIYDSIINPDFFIEVDKNLSPILTGLAHIIDGMGGLNGVLALTANLMNAAFGEKIAQSIRDVVASFGLASGAEARAVADYKAQILASAANDPRYPGPDSAQRRLDLITQESQLQQKAAEISERVSEADKKRITTLLQQANLIKQQTEEYIEQEAEIEKIVAREKEALAATGVQQYNTTANQHTGTTARSRTKLQQAASDWSKIPNPSGKGRVVDPSKVIGDLNKFNTFNATITTLGDNIDRKLRLEMLTEQFTKLGGVTASSEAQLREMLVTVGGLSEADVAALRTTADLEAKFKEFEQETTRVSNEIAFAQHVLQQFGGKSKADVDALTQSLEVEAQAHINSKLSVDQHAEAYERLKQIQLEATQYNQDYAAAMVTVGQSLTRATMAMNGIKSLSSMVAEGSFDITQAFSSLGMVSLSLAQTIPNAINGFKGLSLTMKNGIEAARGMEGAVTSIGGAVTAAMPIITLLAMAITAVISIVNAYEKAQSEANKKAIERAEALRDEASANADLISQMSDALDAYKDNEDSKEALDEATQKLADAYKLEGATLAELTGKYEDYETVLRNAQKAKSEAAERNLPELQAGLVAAGSEIEYALKKTKGEGGSKIGDAYSFDFGGIFNDTTGKAIRALQDAGLTGFIATGSGAGQFDFTLENITKAYDALTKARNEMIASGEEETKEYERVSVFLSSLSESIDKYRSILEDVRVTQLELGRIVDEQGNEYVFGIKPDDIETMADYLAYRKELAGVIADETERASVLDVLVSRSLNDNLKNLYKIYNAVQDIKSLVGRAWSENELFEFFEDDKYEDSILLNLDWRGLSLAPHLFNDAYNSAKNYADALKQVSDATVAIENVETLQKAIKKSKGSLNEEILQQLESDESWTQGDLEAFFGMTPGQRKNFLQDKLTTEYTNQLDGIRLEIAATQDMLEQKREELNSVDKESLEIASQKVDLWTQMSHIRKEFSQDPDNTTEDFLTKYADIANQLEEEEFDFGKLLTINDDAFQTTLDNATRNSQILVDNVRVTEEGVDSLQDDLNSKSKKLIITARLQFQAELTSIEDSVDDIVNIFDAIKKGVSETTDAAGKKVWGFSLEAAQAIDALYPGFMTNAELLRDGTFQLTDDMYQAFFAADSGILSADAQSKMKLLENERAIVQAKIQTAEDALEIATSLAEGETTIEELSAQQKGKLLDAFKVANAQTNGDILENEVELLQSSDTNWSNLWTNVSKYSAQGATNMATSVAQGTASVLTNLQNIRDAAWAAAQQYAEIGKSNPVPITGSWSAAGAGGIDYGTIDTSGSDSFLSSLTTAISESNDAVNTLQKSLDQAVGEELANSARAALDKLYATDAALATAESKLLSSMDEAIDKLGGKKGGGGGKDQKKYWKDVEDRYHAINRELQKQKDLLEDINNITDRRVGQQKLDLLQQEADIYKDQVKTLTEKYDQTQAYLNGWDNGNGDSYVGDVAMLQSLLGTDQTLTITEAGIANYEQLLRYNMDRYNAQIAAGVTKESAEKLYDDTQHYLEQLEKTLDEAQSVKDEIEEVERSLKDNALEQIEVKLQIAIDIKDLRKQLLEMRKKVIESYSDALYEAPKLWGKDGIMQQSAQEELAMLQAYTENAAALEAELANATDATDVNRIIEDLKNLNDNIEGTLDELLAWLDTWEHMFTDALDAARARFDEFLNDLSHNQSVAKTIRELMVLQGQSVKTKQGFDDLQKAELANFNSALAQAKLNKQWYDNVQQRLAEQERLLATATEGTSAYDTYKSNVDALKQELKDAEDAMYSSAKEAMESAATMFTDQIERAKYQFSQAVSNNTGLDLLQEKYEHYIEKDKRYFDQVNEAYYTDSWYRKLQKDIDDTKNKAIKEQLKALQAEIDIRREGNKLSQYDLDILEAKYNVLQAQMALEDARNNKSQLRLVRDGQGNWNYRYTVNTDDIAQAEQDLADAQNEWYNIAKQQTTDISKQIIDTWAECRDACAQIYEDMASGVLTPIEGQKKLAETVGYYTDKIAALEEEKKIAMTDMAEAGNASVDGFRTNYIDTLSEMTAGTETFSSDLASYISTMQEDFDDYQEKIDQVADQAGTDLDTLRNRIDEVEKSTEKLGTEGSKKMQEYWDSLDQIAQAQQDFAQLALQIEGVITDLIELAKHNTQTITVTYRTVYESSGTPGSPTDLSGTGTNTGVSLVGDTGGGNISGGGGVGGGGNGNSGSSLKYYQVYNGNGVPIGTRYTSEAGAQDWINKNSKNVQLIDDPYGIGEYWIIDKDDHDKILSTWSLYSEAYKALQSYKYSYKEVPSLLPTVKLLTGGYTGEWGASGRLAMLHEKELVLNKEDTANMLAAVRTLRDIPTAIFRSIEAMLDGDAAAAMQLAGARLGTPSNVSRDRNGFEQMVHIEANFPNAVYANEIEEAINNLISHAEQYANGGV